MTGHETDGSTTAFPIDGWRSANRCGPDGGNCVQVNLAARDESGAPDVVGVRDSKPAAGPALVFGLASWRSFVSATVVHNIHG